MLGVVPLVRAGGREEESQVGLGLDEGGDTNCTKNASLRVQVLEFETNSIRSNEKRGAEKHWAPPFATAYTSVWLPCHSDDWRKPAYRKQGTTGKDTISRYSGKYKGDHAVSLTQLAQVPVRSSSVPPLPRSPCLPWRERLLFLRET